MEPVTYSNFSWQDTQALHVAVAAKVPQFLVKYKSQLHALDGRSAANKHYEHEDMHIVDLVMTFKPGGPLNQFALAENKTPAVAGRGFWVGRRTPD